MSQSAYPVFLDRDGTIIADKRYLADPDQVELEVGAVAGLRMMVALGVTLIVVTNQSGIGRKLFTLADAIAVNARLDALLREQGIEIAGWYLCPHAPAEHCRCRKPAPGLIEQAVNDLNVEPTTGYVIGDKISDMELAAGVHAKGILVLTGEGASAEATAAAGGFAIASTLIDAAALIAVDQSGRRAK